jgi:hypothetical protein
MSITLRSVKGAALSHAELDANFTDLIAGQTTALAATGGTIDGNVLLTAGAGLLWDDITGEITVKGGGANNPSWAAFQGGIYAYQCSASTMQEVWIDFHILHDIAPGTLLYPHVHWSTTGTNTGVVRWGIEYTVAKGHQQQAFPATTTVYVEQAGSGTAHQHMIAEVSLADAIPATNIEVDALVMTRIFRDASHANDTQTDPAFLLMADLHYQKQYLGTLNKSPNFYA